MSAVALHKRLKTSGPWLRWIAAELCRRLQDRPVVPEALRPRAVDSTTIQRPGKTTSTWRVHYSLDLVSLGCDWHQLTDSKGAEGLERTPVRPGDVLIGDEGDDDLDGRVAEAFRHGLGRTRWRTDAALP